MEIRDPQFLGHETALTFFPRKFNGHRWGHEKLFCKIHWPGNDVHGIFTNPSFIVDLFMPCGCMVFALSIYNYSRALRTDSLLLIISSSGMSSTSTSLCPFGLKCCGTASSVLCSMTLRCSPNLSRNACFVYPIFCWCVGDVFPLATLYHVNEIFGSACDHLFFMYYRIWYIYICFSPYFNFFAIIN